MSLTASYLDQLDARLEKQGGRDSIVRVLLAASKENDADDTTELVKYHEQVRVVAATMAACCKHGRKYRCQEHWPKQRSRL